MATKHGYPLGDEGQVARFGFGIIIFLHRHTQVHRCKQYTENVRMPSFVLCQEWFIRELMFDVERLLMINSINLWTKWYIHTHSENGIPPHWYWLWFEYFFFLVTTNRYNHITQQPQQQWQKLKWKVPLLLQ